MNRYWDFIRRNSTRKPSSLAKYGTIVLVGRDRAKLAEVQKAIKQKGHEAEPVICDLSDPASVRRATSEIVALGLPVAGLLNNAGIMQMHATKNRLGWDTTFATNHLGPFAFTEALIPHLPDGSNVVFVASGVEDPERRPARVAGFRGGRYISAEASARGEWRPGGSKLPGGDAYATSKQCTLATAFVFAREIPRLRFNAFEPGFNPSTGLGRDANVFLRLIAKGVLPLFAPFVKYWSTPTRAARVTTKILTDTSGQTGVYYDENGRPMTASAQVRDTAFSDRVVAETALFSPTSQSRNFQRAQGDRLFPIAFSINWTPTPGLHQRCNRTRPTQVGSQLRVMGGQSDSVTGTEQPPMRFQV